MCYLELRPMVQEVVKRFIFITEGHFVQRSRILLCNIGRGHYVEHLWEMKIIFLPIVQEEMLLKENVYGRPDKNRPQ